MSNIYTEKITANLNPAQKAGAQHVEGPLLLLAGAGSGKTRVLTHRMAYLIASGFAAPNEILAVTFTNKAAKEMESRIFKILLDLGVTLVEPLWVSTFHAFCSRMIRRHYDLLDYKPGLSIYDDGDQLSLIKKICNQLNINDKIHPPKAFRARINHAKQLALGPKDVQKSSEMFFDDKSLQVYQIYEEEMKRANAVDFGDLLLKTYDLFRSYPDLLAQYQQQFKFVMVDEYQDTNHIQYLIVKMLASSHRNLCVVGDEDQSIYSWRGADISNILGFEKDFKDAVVIKLEENYRSTSNIVRAAQEVIKNNTQRKDKTLFTSNPEGDAIRIREERSEYDEAKFVARTIQNMIQEGEGSLSDYAVFYRTNSQSRVIEEQLRSISIPYKIVGGVRFYDRAEVKDILCYLKLVMNPADDMAFRRILNVPARGIGKTTLEKLDEFAAQNKVTLTEAASACISSRTFNAGTTSKIRNFLLLVEDLRDQLNQHSLLDFYQIVLEKTEYLARLKAENSIESDSRINNLEEFSNALSQFMKERSDATLQMFLEEMALVSDVDNLDENQNSVTLMTIHASKGLEFLYVFIVGLEENLFPSGSREDNGDDEAELEEERRLAYVGYTRAREKLFLTYAKTRKIWGQEHFNEPSRFIREIPKEITQFSTGVTQMPQFMNRYTQGSGSSTSNYSKPNFRNAGFDDGFESQSFADDDDVSSSGGPNFKKGMKVRHPTFGAGSIYEVEGSGEQMKVGVLFADQTIKKFVVKYARLERI